MITVAGVRTLVKEWISLADGTEYETDAEGHIIRISPPATVAAPAPVEEVAAPDGADAPVDAPTPEPAAEAPVGVEEPTSEQD